MTQKKNLAEFKRKYDVARHHAWAGSVILAIILAIRIFLETSYIKINDWIIVTIGGFIVVYTLVAVVLTYKYRSGLTSEQKIIEVHTSSGDVEKEMIKTEVEKEHLKLEKKKSKVQLKSKKKSK